MALHKGGSNWVDGERFYDREAELAALAERASEGTHTLLTAQRRMGKTSLLREHLRRLSETGGFETIFVDVEAADSAADAIAEIATESISVRPAWGRIRSGFANVLGGLGDRIETIGVGDARVKLRAGIDAGNWQQKGDDVLRALAASDTPVVMAIDELPILVNRLLKGHDYRVTPERREATDLFLAWLRRNGQRHRGRIVLIVCGSIGLEPILRQSGLSAHANIYAPFDLKPWDEATAASCISELAFTYGLVVPPAVGERMCRRLRLGVPHHVQQFFDSLHLLLQRAGRAEATLGDVESVYREDMLGARGQAGMDHYESRLRVVLGPERYPLALDLLTEASGDSGLVHATADAYRSRYAPESPNELTVDDILHVLEHDGYLVRQSDGYRFLSGWLEDWWHARYGASFVPLADRST